MKDNETKDQTMLTEDALLVVNLSKALFSKDIDRVFRILGSHLDKYRLKVSADVLKEYQLAERFENV